jgi:tetratricopeptide (TPR) repeat protein
LNEITQTSTSRPVSEPVKAASGLAEATVSIRVSPNSYFIALILGTFFTAFLFYLELDAAGVSLFVISWVCIPFFALNDRIVFDGRRLSRSGVIPRIWSWLHGSRRRLKLSDIEQIETQAVRALKRGGNVFYRYRTAVRGKDLQIAFASGGDDYRRMIAGILPRVADNVLDNRSMELRDHLADPKETLMKAEFEHIPSADVLKDAVLAKHRKIRRLPREAATEDMERVDYLRSLANELRLNGYLLQALEAFRRALVIKPRDGRLLFEFARCLQSFAGTERNGKLERRAIAALRLAEMRADEDGDLLTRLGEAYFQAGDWQRAASAFQKALDRVGEGFRSARGLAEIALREGKIAHVIHHFSTANRLAETPSLRRWTKGEADYFSRLNADDEYMELEVSRVSMLETLERSKRTALHIAFIGFPTIFVGVLFEDALIADIGWAVSTISLLIWTGLIVSVRMLSPRIPYELMETED